MTTQQTHLSHVPEYNLSEFPDSRSQTLQRLLQKSHASLAPLRDPNLMYHTHMPHHLGSSYLLGASSVKLDEIYNHEAPSLKPVSDFIRGGITLENWRRFLTRKEYTVAFTDFFDTQVSENHGDWKRVVDQFLHSGEEPLINGCTGGIGHPLIHLAYAYEFQSKEVATEALSLACTEYDPTHRFLDRYTADTSTYHSTSLADILLHVHSDDRFDGYFDQPGYTNIRTILSKQEPTILEHWNAWVITDPLKQLEECVDTAVLLSICTSNSLVEYDFFLAHLLTVGHALRVLMPHFRPVHHEPILKQYVLFAILVYIAQLRPKFGKADVETVDLKDRDWEWVSQTALAAEWSLDLHYAKVIRALKVSAETWGEKDNFYSKAAVKFVTGFNGWTGFGLGVE